MGKEGDIDLGDGGFCGVGEDGVGGGVGEGEAWGDEDGVEGGDDGFGKWMEWDMELVVCLKKGVGILEGVF